MGETSDQKVTGSSPVGRASLLINRLQRSVGIAFPGPGRKSLTKAEREQPKGNLRARIAGRDSGIELNTNFRWVFSGIKRPALFFEHLALLLAPMRSCISRVARCSRCCRVL